MPKRIILFIFCILLPANVLIANLPTNANFLGYNLSLALGTSSTVYRHYQINTSDITTKRHDHGNNNFCLFTSSSYLFPLNSHWVFGPSLHVQYNVSTTLRMDPDNLVEENRCYWNYGLDAKIGYATSCNNLFYLLIGPEIACVKSKYSFVGPVSTGQSFHNLLGLDIGVGAEQVITNNFHISEQINYDWFGAATTHLSGGGYIRDVPRIITATISFIFHW